MLLETVAIGHTILCVLNYVARVILCVLHANVTDLTLCREVYDSIAVCPWLACYGLHVVDVSIAQCTGLISLELCKNTEPIKATTVVSPLLTCHAAFFACCA